jgi:hypothetical protein
MPGRVIVVFIDRSASARDDQDIYARAIGKILNSLDLGDRIVISPITDKSERDFKADIDKETPTAVPEQSWFENDLQYKRKVRDSQENLKQSKESLGSKIQQMLGSDNFAGQSAILQSMQIAQQIFAAERRRRILILLSDMLEDSGPINFEKDHITDAFIKTVIEQQKKSDLLPDLTDVSVYVAGARAESPERAAAVQRFWETYFKAAGATVAPGHYSRALLAFEK